MLSPLVFAMYINELAISVLSTLLYADDMKLFHVVHKAEDNKFFQAQLNIVSLWCRDWRLNLNITKCSHLRISLNEKPVESKYRVGSERLQRVDTNRDLGNLVDEKLTFAAHIDSTIRKANRALGCLT